MNGNTSRSFRDFALNGDAITIASALLIALAVYSFLQTLVEAMIEPLVAAIFDEPEVYALHFTISDNAFRYGNVLVALMLVALAFAVVVGASRIYKGAAGHSDEA
jgi:large conductance mechanosensitive channel